ncbi:MAG: ankyrin repeat domain-containing protein [Magnetococcales bacterium]|nr:ankyrin repeat domain-containing protein [Magnetococcales bacterium]
MKEIVTCRQCGARYKVEAGAIPLTGLPVTCRHCHAGFIAPPTDAAIRQGHGPEIAAYVLFRKRHDGMSGLAYDLKRVALFGKYLTKKGKKWGEVDDALLDAFFARVGKKLEPTQMQGLQATLKEFFRIVAEEGVIPRSPLAPTPEVLPPPPHEEGETVAVSCQGCGTGVTVSASTVPEFGRCVTCPQCGGAAPVLKPDDYYRDQFAPELAEYILYRKRNRLLASLEFDVRRIEDLERWLANSGHTLCHASTEHIRGYLESQGAFGSTELGSMTESGDPGKPEKRDSLLTTYHDLYTVLMRQGLVTTNPCHILMGVDSTPLRDAGKMATVCRLSPRLVRHGQGVGWKTVVAAVASFCLLGGSVMDWLQGRQQRQEAVNTLAKDERAPTLNFHKAAAAGDVEQVRRHLEAGTSLLAQESTFGDTVLHTASYHGHGEVVDLLVAKGAPVNLANQYGNTPLHRSIPLGRESVARSLLAQGATIDVRNQDGDTPLHVAVRHGQIRLAGLLLARGADAKAVNQEGDTPLLLAVRGGYEEAVRVLMRAGSDPLHTDRSGLNALQLARERGQEGILRLMGGEAEAGGVEGTLPPLEP